MASAKHAGSDVEVIVVDDASVDETAKVCGSLHGIRYVRVEHNQRVAGARNVGLLASSAEYIAFHDDDDLRLSHSLDWQIDALAANPDAGMAVGGVAVGDQDTRPLHDDVFPPPGLGDVFWQLMELNYPILPIAAVVRRLAFSESAFSTAASPG